MLDEITLNCAPTFHASVGLFPICPSVEAPITTYFVSQDAGVGAAFQSEVTMAEIIQFIPKTERERTRLIREARAMYESVFPSADRVNERIGKPEVTHPLDSTGIDATPS